VRLKELLALCLDGLHQNEDELSTGSNPIPQTVEIGLARLVSHGGKSS